MRISIAELTINDIDFIKELEIENNLSRWSRGDYAKEINRAESIALILSENGCRRGFIIGRLLGTNTFVEAEIYNIAIKKTFQNRNFGTILLEDFIRNGQKHKLGKIFIEVRKSNCRAINFYQKNKFVEIGKRRNYYTDPVEDAILMSRSIDS